MQLILIVIGIAVCLTACAHLPPECRTEYAHTYPHCPDLPRRPQNAQECKQVGGIAVTEDGYYKGCANPEELRRILGHR
jgi:hypothetical protein